MNKLEAHTEEGKHMTDTSRPFAGAKQSGIGVEMGQEGLKEFTQATIINVAK